MPLLIEFTDNKKPAGYIVWCPGCMKHHAFYTKQSNNGHQWKFNGDMEKPTFSPSLLINYKGLSEKGVCHSFVRDGQWHYLNDCTHHLKGKTVPMVDLDAV